MFGKGIDGLMEPTDLDYYNSNVGHFLILKSGYNFKRRAMDVQMYRVTR